MELYKPECDWKSSKMIIHTSSFVGPYIIRNKTPKIKMENKNVKLTILWYDSYSSWERSQELPWQQ